MSTTSVGRHAESVVAAYLITQGYAILDRNWKTRRCEIDIIAQQAGLIRFVEVKYRAQALSGDGLAAVTAYKLKQMTFAAYCWVHYHHYSGDYCLAAAAVSGSNYRIDRLIWDVTV